MSFLVRSLVPRGRHRLWLAAGAACAMAAGLASPMAGVAAQGPATGRSLSSPTQPLGQEAVPTPVTPGDWGATYHWLEDQAVRVTTHFVDAVATAERDVTGDLKARLTDLAGNELATVAVDRRGDQTATIEMRLPDRPAMRAAGRADIKPKLDWSNRQVYTLWKDRELSRDRSLEWNTTLIRPRGAERHDIALDIVTVQTDWRDGLAATAGRRAETTTAAPGRGTRTRPVLVSRLSRDGVEVGASSWYPEEGVFEWSLPGLTQGWVNAERLKEIGGWTFTPDLPWLNVQGYAFHQFHGLVATQGFVAKREAGLVDRVIGLLVPTVRANEPGCDGLHWLDGSIFRPCCDIHDACYTKEGCTSRSWWAFWESWNCGYCNGVAFFCFITAYSPHWDIPF